MSTLPQNQKAPAVSGTLDSKLSQGFLSVLQDLIKTTGPKVLLRFNKSTDNITINAVNDQRNVIAMVEYDKSISSALNYNRDVCHGIYNLGELYSMLRVFDSGYSIELDEGSAMFTSDQGQEYTHLGSEADVIKEGPKTLKSRLDWVAEFKWSSEKFASFKKSLSILSHKYIFIEGKKNSKEITLYISDKGVKSSSFKQTVVLEDPVTDNFRFIMNKENFVSVVSGSLDSLTVQVSNSLMCLYGANEFYKAKYYVSPIVGE